MPSVADVAAHNSRTSCWVIIAGSAYDVTEFLDDHPGGANIILRYAGKDATEEYEPVHAPGTIESHLSSEHHLGTVTGLQAIPAQTRDEPTAAPTISYVTASDKVLPLFACQSLEDLEQAGRSRLSPKAAAYFDSGAETRATLRRNRSDWGRIGLRPRVLRNVQAVSLQCKIMGSESSLPIFIAPAAAARLGHKDGELCLARGAARMAIPQCVCTYASVAPKDIMSDFQSDPGRRGGALFFQLYIPKAKQDAVRLISHAKAVGFKALVVTVDSAVIGKRDDDDRFKALLDYEAGLVDEMPLGQPPLPGQEAETLRGVHCSTLEWSDLSWIRSHWGQQPLIVKGIQTAEDALEATRHDVDGIYLSNHGGRQLDYAPSSVRVLLEIKQRCPDVFNKVDVYVDGGIMRGTDVVKALCLGARGVGIGRGFIYALSAYGTEGVLKAVQILSDEIQTAMRLLGVTRLAQLDDSFLDLSDFTQSVSGTQVFPRL